VEFFDTLYFIGGMESPDFAEWLMTPTVKDRGGSFCHPPKGGFLLAGSAEKIREGKVVSPASFFL
jgi:hypothetical protein